MQNMKNHVTHLDPKNDHVRCEKTRLKVCATKLVKGFLIFHRKYGLMGC